MKRFRNVLLFLICASLLFSSSCRKISKETGSSEAVMASSEYVAAEVFPESEPAAQPEESQTESYGQSSAVQSASSQTESTKPQTQAAAPSDETRAVWISFLEYEKILKGKTEKQFTAAACEMLDNCVNYGFNTVIVHARSHGDAFYKSSLFPESLYFTGSRQNNFPFDPLEIMVAEAHRRGLKIEAWVNPYRGNKLIEAFSEDDIVEKWLGAGKVFASGEYYYFNPGEPEVRELVLKGVIEIVEKYDVDGIHFDDYFYPTTIGNDDSTAADSAAFKTYGAGRTLSQFRTDCVNELVSSVYREIKSRKNIMFGISPAGNVDNCIMKNHADVRLWGGTAGYVDYLAPQIYWDYGQGSLPYEKALGIWSGVVTNPKVKLLAGLAAYRAGDPESLPYWSSGNVLARQVSDARALSAYGGFVMFRYDFFFADRLAAERNNLEQIL